MDHLPAEIERALRADGRAEAGRREPRYAVRAEGGVYPTLNVWSGGFSVAVEDAPRLRGFVDLMCGEDRLARCLIVLAEEEAGIIRYEYKRRTEDATKPPADYEIAENAPTALLT